MATVTNEPVWSCRRDYWELEVVRVLLVPGRRLARIRARRRTTEALGPPLVVDHAALERLSWSFQSALAVVAGFRAVGVHDCPGRFPTRIHLARCAGALYELDIHGTAVASQVESVELVLTVPDAGSRPVVELIEADIEAFAADLVEMLQEMTGRSANANGRLRAL